MPAPIEACRAGFMPSPAARICPRMTSDTSFGATLARRHDAVAPRQNHERRSAEVFRTHRLSADPPLSARRRVVAVPGAQALDRDLARERHAVIDPILKRDKAAGCLAFRIKRGEASEFALGEERVEHQE